MNEQEKIKAKIITLLQKKVVFAYIFGSLASGRVHQSSDIDVAVYLPQTALSLTDKMDFIDRLSTAFSREVDVIFLNDADIIITMQILTNGQLLIDNSPAELVLFKAQKAGLYADFKLSRQIIEQNLLCGRIYA
jgi:predicted nucleotidyltransferase